MKKFLKNLLPLILLCCYAIIAGGSLEDIEITLGITVGVIAVIGIIAAIVVSVNNNNKRKEGLSKAKEQFGNYTKEVEYQLGKYILYDETTQRLLLKDSIVDSTKLAELKTTERAPSTTTTYKKEQVTKTSTGSAVGRVVAGALIAGPVGAAIGGVTAKQKTETKETPEYYTVPGYYTIDVIDVLGNSRAEFATQDKGYHHSVKNFLQNIIDENTKESRLALQQAQENEQQKLLSANPSSLILGGDASSIESLLINSSVVKRTGCNKYKLCQEAVGVINRGWNSNFENIQVTIKDQIISKMNAISVPFTAGHFKNMLLEVGILAQKIDETYGEPQMISSDISYTSLTEDNNCLNAYLWNKDGVERQKIDIMYEKGKYKYQLVAEKNS
ncbi:MAG: hypothetical protein WCR82_02290 [Bacteroidales bacterium]|jgi:hypothetical protein